MIVSAYLLALQAVPQEQAPPEIERPYLEAVATWFLCAKREIDTVPSRDRWRQSEQVVDAALAACTAEEAAYAVLRRQYNAESVERLMTQVRGESRDNMIAYARR
jgi:hypothetical protein